MAQDIILGYFERARSRLSKERDSMVSKIKEEIGESKRKTISKV
jgi:hypothetical protein